MTMDDDLSFGVVLRRYRLAAGLTQATLAQRAGLSQRAVNDLERDPRRLPRLETLALLTDALALAPPERERLVAAAHPRETAPAVVLARESGPAPPPSSPLIGRTSELALLERHLRGEGPPVLVLAGEPGIGKTRLLHETMRRATALGWQMLHGGCQRRGGQEPYAPLLETLAHAVQLITPTQRPAALRGCAWLTRLLPELAEESPHTSWDEPLSTWSLPPEQERRLIFESVARFLANVARARGTLLVLDDLQWAGSDALDLLATLVRSAGLSAGAAPPLRVVAAYRNTQEQPRDLLSVTLADLAHAGLVTHQTLAPLSLHETRALLDAILPPGTGDDAGQAADTRASLADRLVQRTGGVPFFVLSCAGGLARRARLDAPETPGAADRETEIPWDVAQSVRQRVAMLSEETRVILGAAAVIGRSVPVDILTAVVTRPAEQVLDALDAACGVRLLDDDGAAGFRFSHDVIREVIEADVRSARRALHHQRVAEALEQRADPPVEEVAYHYARSGRADKAVRYLELAGDHAMAQRAHAAAEGYYRDLVERLDRMTRPVDAARMREKWAAVLRIGTHYDAALPVLERAVEAYTAARDQESMMRAEARIGQVYTDLGMPDEGLQRLQRVLDAVDPATPSHGLAALHVALAALYDGAGQYAEQLAAADRALELALIVGDARVEASATYLRSAALLQLGQMTGARPILAQAIAQAEVVGDLEVLCWALNALAIIHIFAGEFDAAKQYSARARAIAERHGDRAQIAFMTHKAALPAFFLGEWAEARGGFEQAVAAHRQIHGFIGPAYTLLELGRLSLAEGRWDEATHALDESITMAARNKDPEALRLAQALRAELDIVRGHPDKARARLTDLRDTPDQQEAGVTFLLPVLAWAHLEMGDVVTARTVVEQAVVRSRAQSYRLALVEALRVQALVAMREGRWAEAEQSLEEGLVLTRCMHYPYAEARLLHVYGEMHAVNGLPAHARERLEAALAVFERLGARKDAERARQALANLSSPSGQTPAPMWIASRSTVPPCA